MSELFPEAKNIINNINAPLADRIRPANIDEMVGQQHLIGKDGPLRKFFEDRDFPSMIFWGPPGVGKTTFALMIADHADHDFTRLSAVESGVKDVRKVIAQAEIARKRSKKTLLFIDEIHRFNKSQQDALLHAVEKGIITLIGATTENPSFEVNSALLSRCQVYRLKLLSDEDVKKLVERAINNDEILKTKSIQIQDWDFLLNISAGDARTALNAIELSLKLANKNDNDQIIITREFLEKALQQKTAHYDKAGESHYDTISAFIKSLRGSDPDAAMFWLVKMLEAGEDAKFIARRMVIFASEDIGNADPFAVSLAVSIFDAVNLIGLPEAAINLAQGVTYLASAAKSNASYLALRKAESIVRSGVSLTVPLHLRNAPTKLMKQEGYGKEYQYPHDFKGKFVKENYFPEEYDHKEPFYKPCDEGREGKFKQRLEIFWEERYK
jgi:putative ATPase